MQNSIFGSKPGVLGVQGPKIEKKQQKQKLAAERLAELRNSSEIIGKLRRSKLNDNPGTGHCKATGHVLGKP